MRDTEGQQGGLTSVRNETCRDRIQSDSRKRGRMTNEERNCNRRGPGGLRGGMAACQRRGMPVTLYEMKPDKFTPAHHSANICRTGLLQFARSEPAAKRRRPAEGGNAPAWQFADPECARTRPRFPPAARWRWIAIQFSGSWSRQNNAQHPTDQVVSRRGNGDSCRRPTADHRYRAADRAMRWRRQSRRLPGRNR